MAKGGAADPFKGRTPDDFKSWLKKREVKAATIAVLGTKGFNTFRKFAASDPSDFDAFPIDLAQKRLLKDLAKEAQEMKKGRMTCPKKPKKAKGKQPGPQRKKDSKGKQPGPQRKKDSKGKQPGPQRKKDSKSKQPGPQRKKDSKGKQPGPQRKKDSKDGRVEQKLLPCVRRLLKHFKQKQPQQQASNEQSQPSAMNFGRKQKRALDVRQVRKVLQTAPESVGLIFHDSSAKGTGFRVGKDCIMTCWHVVRKDEMTQNILSPLQVEFTSGRNPKRFDISGLMYGNKDLDVAILKMDDKDRKRKIPGPLHLSSQDHPCPLYLLGHPGFAFDKSMMVDPCVQEVRYIPNGDWNAISAYYQVLQERCNSAENIHAAFVGTENFHFRPPELSFDELFDDNFIACHTAFMHGASGSPGLVLEGEEAKVRLMLCRGVPNFYHTLTDVGRALHPMPNEKFRFEQGPSMKKLYQCMTQWMTRDENPEVRKEREMLIDDIFSQHAETNR